MHCSWLSCYFTTEGGTAPVGTAARQLQYPSGSGSEALQSAGGAVVLSAHQSDLSDAQPLAVSVAQEVSQHPVQQPVGQSCTPAGMLGIILQRLQPPMIGHFARAQAAQTSETVLEGNSIGRLFLGIGHDWHVRIQALETLVGLQGKPKGPHSFQYTHQQSGFTFELGPVPPSSESSSSDDDEDTGPDAAPAAMELEYNPVALGAASAVRRPLNNINAHLW